MYKPVVYNFHCRERERERERGLFTAIKQSNGITIGYYKSPKQR